MLFLQNSILIWICLLLLGLSGCNFNPNAHADHAYPMTAQAQIVPDSTRLIPAEEFYSDYFPCNDCHNELPSNSSRRELVEMHEEIQFDHDSENRWCLACHSESDRDSLVLAGGKHLGFDESFKLCGQCHGPKYRDWKLGIHGKRTGEWDGQKLYLLCVNCHDPHSPKIKKLEPMPPPRRPEQIKWDTIYERPEQ